MQDIDVYYESLKQVYDKIIRWPDRKAPFRERLVDWIVGIAVALFLLSLIPILPVGIMYLAGRYRFALGPINLYQITLGSFILVWFVTTLVGGAFLAIALWLNSKIDSSRELQSGSPQTLSDDQLTFIAAYEAYKDLKVFFVSHIEQHVGNCLSAVIRLLPSARDRIEAQELLRVGRLFPEGIDMEYLAERPRVFRKGSGGLPRQISIAEAFLQTFEKHAWFHLDAETKSTLQALIEFPDKVFYRLSKREDLPSVLSVLESLSKFAFAFLPEHKTYMAASVLEALHAEGYLYLKRFAEEVNAMTSYPHPTVKMKTKSEVAENWISKFVKSGYPPILMRFTIWFILILLLTAGGVYLASLKFTLAPDSMTTLIIGTSVAGAAGLTAILPRGGKSD